jgi:hypothetical protein
LIAGIQSNGQRAKRHRQDNLFRPPPSGFFGLTDAGIGGVASPASR